MRCIELMRCHNTELQTSMTYIFDNIATEGGVRISCRKFLNITLYTYMYIYITILTIIDLTMMEMVILFSLKYCYKNIGILLQIENLFL